MVPARSLKDDIEARAARCQAIGLAYAGAFKSHRPSQKHSKRTNRLDKDWKRDAQPAALESQTDSGLPVPAHFQIAFSREKSFVETSRSPGSKCGGEVISTASQYPGIFRVNPEVPTCAKIVVCTTSRNSGTKTLSVTQYQTR
jgi:hypothetical protein